LAFFLGLLDTIEPVKYFYNINPICVLKHIDITYSAASKQIIITQIPCEDNTLIFDFARWQEEKMSDLPNWLQNISTELVEDNRQITITIGDASPVDEEG
jgi:hypothetical protein